MAAEVESGHEDEMRWHVRKGLDKEDNEGDPEALGVSLSLSNCLASLIVKSYFSQKQFSILDDVRKP